MRALCYSDLQATSGHEQCYHDPAKPLQQWRVEKFFERLHKIFVDYQCDCLWDLGDTTDDRNAVPLPVIDTVIAGISLFPKTDWNIKLIGNHEQFVKNTRVNIGKLFKGHFEIVEDCEVFETEALQIICCSYPENDKNVAAWINEQRTNSMLSLLLGHFQVAGAQQSGGTALTGVDKHCVEWVDLGLLGHIHKPQRVCANVHYVGSPFQQHWGEKGEEKRVAVVDTSNLEVLWVPMKDFPAYREISFEEFAKMGGNHGEDRFKVLLRSPEESAQFYRHKHAHQAVPVYEYTPQEEAKKTSAVSWERDEVFRRYLERNPPGERNIPVSTQDMIDFGLEIANG
jgi:hypothetical protein